MRLIMLLLILFLVAPPVFRSAVAADGEDGRDTPPVINESEAARFQQQKALAHMRELEERMYRLSELIREAEPDHAARLVLGLRMAREEFIVDEMKEITGLIEGKRYRDATEKQRVVLIKLDELRKLLLSTDLDLILKLERLRKLNAAIEKLEKIIAEEQRERDRSGELARDQAARDDERLERLRRDQEENQRATDTLRSDVDQISSAGMEAPSSLSRASGSMGRAASSLGQGRPSEAGARQKEAIEELEEALADLERERNELRDELGEQIRAEVMDALAQMLERQVKVRDGTEVAASETGIAERDEKQVLLVAAEREIIGINEKTIALIEKTEFSFALPFALQAVGRSMEQLVRELATGHFDEPVVVRERQIEADLASLLETMKEEQQGAAQAGRPSQGGCPSCNQRNKLVAELKVVRFLQVRINRMTIDADRGRPADLELLADDLKRAIEGARDREDKVSKITGKLHDLTCPDCVPR